MGELAYVWGKIRGTAHCALCDITHRGVSKKKQWKEYEDRIRVPIELLHINEQEEALPVHGREDLAWLGITLVS